MTENAVIGIDFGSDSVRAAIFDAANGNHLGDAVAPYPRWQQDLYCDSAKDQYRQHPLDYLESMELVVCSLLASKPNKLKRSIKGISVGTTGSTPVAVNRAGTPLALTTGHEDNPNAMFVLWKDHTAIKEADEINRLAREWNGPDYTRYVGGTYSPEWFWAKILHVLREDKRVRSDAWSWMEHCDWISAELCGDTNPLTVKRSRCAAGHKAIWHAEFGGLPDELFLTQLDPLLAGIRSRLYSKTYTSDTRAGTLSTKWASKFGLKEDVCIGVGALDAHMGAVGAGIEPFNLVKVMGTSTCDMLVVPQHELGNNVVNGICGQVDGSIIPGMLGLEAGQSAFGDIYAWYKDLLLWPTRTLVENCSQFDTADVNRLVKELDANLISVLCREADSLHVDSTGIVALDWLNGRRTPDANPALKGAIAGLTLGTSAPRLFRALVEATAFGSRKIMEKLSEQGIRPTQVIALGGVAKRSSFIMQVMADVLNMEIKVAREDQACALGSAMCASVASSVHSSLILAQQKMHCGFECEYSPNAKRVGEYDRLYQQYSSFGRLIERQLGVGVTTS